MADVVVTPEGSGAFRVEVREGKDATTHRVTVPEGYAEELGLAETDVERLVEASFAFLLEREPKESILASFELPVIARYFPSYPDEIARRLG